MSRQDHDRHSERENDRDSRDDRSEATYYPRSDQERDRRPGSPPRRSRGHFDDQFPPPGPPPRGRTYDDGHVARERDRDRQYYEDERYSTPQPQSPPRFAPRRAPGADQKHEHEHTYERRTSVLEREREKDVDARSRPGSPQSRPMGPRRTSSFDGHDRRPINRLYERERYGPPARREDNHPPPPPSPVSQAPLPRTRGLSPPDRQRYDDMPYYNEIKIAERGRSDNDEFHIYPERVREREREVVRTTRRRSRSRDSYTTATASTARGRSRRSGSPSRSSGTASSRSSSSSRSCSTVRSEYPKKGRTKIPARLVSVRALIELGYPFTEQVWDLQLLCLVCARARIASDKYVPGQHHHRPKGTRSSQY